MVERLPPREERTESISVSGIRSFIRCFESYLDKTYSNNNFPALDRSKGVRYSLFRMLAKALINGEIKEEYKDKVKSSLIKQMEREKDYDLKNMMIMLLNEMKNVKDK